MAFPDSEKNEIIDSRVNSVLRQNLPGQMNDSGINNQFQILGTIEHPEGHPISKWQDGKLLNFPD